MLNLDNQKAIDNLHQNFIKPDMPKIQIGDTVKLGVKIIEGNKERVQFYEGTVIAKKNSLTKICSKYFLFSLRCNDFSIMWGL